MKLILASTSPIRKQMFKEAAIEAQFLAPQIDEDALKSELLQRNTEPRDLALELAKAKAKSIKAASDTIIIGCDQVCELEGDIINKGSNIARCVANLEKLQGVMHKLNTAIVACKAGEVVWEHSYISKLYMKPLGKDEIQAYVEKDRPFYCAGSYKLEENGRNLFTKIDGKEDCIKGLPLEALQDWLKSIS